MYTQFQSQNGLILTCITHQGRFSNPPFQSQNGLILTTLFGSYISLRNKFQSQNGLILTVNMIRRNYGHFKISIPKWSDFNEIHVVYKHDQYKFQSQNGLILTLP